MPLFEMPFEQMKEYLGINPVPSDFDAYWQRALDEMAATDPDIEIRKSTFETSFAECFDLFFTGVRGARIHAQYVKPIRASVPHPAIVQFHGYKGNAGDWVDKLPFAAEGFSVFAMDCRGQGGSSEDIGGVKGNTLHGHIIRGLDDEPDNLLFRHIFLDTVELVHLAKSFDEVDEARIGVTGVSQGGALTVACASLAPEINRLAPCYPFLSDYMRVWQMDLAKAAYEELTEYFRRFDPRHEREQEVFTTLGYIDIKNLAGRIRGKVLWGTALMDMVCPPSSQFAAYNRITAEKNMVIYPDFGHETLPGFRDTVLEFMRQMANR
ncbi:MAG: acetylxylan esterase [Spirochaetales bacterium]|nr:acetylxylan esterase [Spirochaetales bacterium]